MTGPRPAKSSRKPRRRIRGGLAARPSARPGRVRRPFWDQINNNLVAIISLVLAISSLGYNTWRNETTEIQRNWRDASFRILVEIGELNQIILMRRYFTDAADTQPSGNSGNGSIPRPESWVRGWGNVAMVRDLTSVMPEPLPKQGRQLFRQWQTHAHALHDRSNATAREEAEAALLGNIEELRIEVVELIANLR